jgi:hypothetical protein
MHLLKFKALFQSTLFFRPYFCLHRKASLVTTLHRLSSSRSVIMSHPTNKGVISNALFNLKGRVALVTGEPVPAAYFE